MSSVLTAFQAMTPRPVDAWMYDTPAVREQLEAQIVRFPSFALPSADRATCITGIVHAHGVAEVWMVTGNGFFRNARGILEQQRQLLRDMYDALHLHRLHILVDHGRKDAARWADLLGFRFEAGPMRKMGAKGNDLDFYIYERERTWAEQ
jgi:hypothetical protein